MGHDRLKRLELRDFRGFESLDLAFEDDLTVLVGVNGAGKTSIIDAIVLAYQGSDGATARDVRQGASNCKISSILMTAEGDQRFSTVVVLPDGTCAHSGAEMGAYPMLVYRVERHAADRTFKASSNMHPTEYTGALRHWSNASGNYDAFFAWFKAMEDLENEQVRYKGAEHNPQLAAVRRAIRAFLPEFNEIRVRRQMLPMAREPVLMLRKGTIELPFDALSEGERTIIAMIGDIARRLALLEPEAEDPLATGITVIIDEIEQHAHPGWQRQILRRFRDTFPNVQLIITTQSPIIVSEVEARQLRVLEDFQLADTSHGPGRDANTVLEDVFLVAPRNEDVQKALDELGDAIEDDAFDRARELLARLDDLVPGGADPEIVYYRNLLARLDAAS